MKRKLFITLLAAITVIAGIFGFTACNPANPTAEPTALEKAYDNYYKTQNMTVTVTDSRVQKYGHDYSATVEVDYAHKTAHTKETNWESYYELKGEGDGRSFIIYNRHINDTTPWDKTVRADLFENLENNYDNETDFNVHLITNWVESNLPTHSMRDTTYSATTDDQTHWASLQFLANKFSESNGGWTASVCLCINNDETYIPYECTATVKLDGQNRFTSCELDFGTNGKISATYTYGTANVTIPDEAKNAQSVN